MTDLVRLLSNRDVADGSRVKLVTRLLFEKISILKPVSSPFRLGWLGRRQYATAAVEFKSLSSTSVGELSGTSSFVVKILRLLGLASPVKE